MLTYCQGCAQCSLYRLLLLLQQWQQLLRLLLEAQAVGRRLHLHQQQEYQQKQKLLAMSVGRCQCQQQHLHQSCRRCRPLTTFLGVQPLVLTAAYAVVVAYTAGISSPSSDLHTKMLPSCLCWRMTCDQWQLPIKKNGRV